MQHLLEELDCNLGWRIIKNRLIRFIVCILLTYLFAFSLREEWKEIRPITGEYNEYVSIQGVVVQEDIRNLENALDKLPNWIVESHYESGGKVFLKSDEFPNYNYTELGDNERVLGTFNTNTKNITILKNCDAMERTLFHEFGHYLDNFYSITETEEFKEIFANERESYKAKVDGNDYHISCEREYFVGAFSIYIESEKKLKKYCPNTYELINDVVNNTKTSH